MRLFLILVMAAVAMAWRKFRARRQAEDAQRRLVQILLDQAADEEAEIDRDISNHWDI
jgi:hypothetical protein